MLKAEVTKDPGRGRDGKVSVKGRGRLGMECRWAVGRQAALLSQAQTRKRRNEWGLAGRRGGGVGSACEAGGKAATKSESWTAVEEVARESLHGQKLREQNRDRGGWGDAPHPAMGQRRKPAGSRLTWETGRHRPESRGPPSLEASS